MLKTLIIDDEPLAHEVIKHHLQVVPDIKLVAQCFNAAEALSHLANYHADLLILDINMPALTGIELLKVLNNRPQVIIVSAYQEYAIEGFELDVADYLLKPVSSSRFNQALAKVRKRLSSMKTVLSTSKTADYIVLNVDREKRKFILSNVTLCEAYGNYVKLWQGDDMILVRSTLKQLLHKLPEQQFMQVHKSYIVNVNHVIAVDAEFVRLKEELVVKIGKTFKDKVTRLL